MKATELLKQLANIIAEHGDCDIRFDTQLVYQEPKVEPTTPQTPDDFVDLDLPSGRLWVSRNIGATAITDFGDYLTHDEAIKAVQDLRDIVLPTKEDFQELVDNTESEWTELDGVPGRKFTAPNGNWLFFPAAGYGNGTSILSVGSFGYYWSRSLDASSPYGAYLMYFSSSGVNPQGYSNRYYGCTVRGVQG